MAQVPSWLLLVSLLAPLPAFLAGCAVTHRLMSGKTPVAMPSRRKAKVLEPNQAAERKTRFVRPPVGI